MRLPAFTKPQVTFLVCVTVAKAIIMTATPLNLDLSYVVSQLDQASRWTMAPYGAFMKMIVEVWLLMPLDHPALASAWSIDSFNPSVGIYVLVFMMKLPLLILEILTGALLYFIASKPELGLSQKNARLVFYLWFLNPYIFLINEMAGAVDIYPTFVVVLAVALIATKRNVLAAGAYGAAVALKLFPVMLLPILVVLTRGNRRRLLFLLGGLVGVAIYIVWLLRAGYDPVLQLLQYDAFTQNFDEYAILSASKNGLGLLSAALLISYALVAVKWKSALTGLLDASLLVFLVYFSFGNWFPQYLIWGIPFLTLDFVRCQRKIWGKMLFAAFIVSALAVALLGFPSYFTSNNTAFLFLPAKGTVLKQYAFEYSTFAQDDFVRNVVGPITRSLFLCTCLIYCLELVKRNGFSRAISRFY